MKKIGQDGKISGLLMGLISVSTLFAVSMAFGVWAFASQQDYKNNSDKKVDAAVDAAEKQLASELEAKFAEDQKSPLKSYIGPTDLGELTLSYPKNWSVYEIKKSGLELYLHPTVVPEVSAQTNYALRVQVLNTKYSDEVKAYQGGIEKGTISAQAYRPTKVASAEAGILLKGDLANKKQGVMLLLPLRDKTIKLWTESLSYESDFMNSVVPSISYNP